MRKQLLHTLVVLLCGISAGAQTIAFQGFEGAASDTWAISGGIAFVSNNTGSGDNPANSRIRTGDYSFQVNNLGIGILDLAAAPVAGYNGVKVIIRLSSTSVNTNGGADRNDMLAVYLNVDGAGFPITPDVSITGNSSDNNAKWDYGATLTASTAAGNPLELEAPQGGLSNNNYSTIEVRIPDGSTTVALRVFASNNNTNEVWNVDDIELVAASTEVFFDPTTTTTLEGAGTYNLNVSIFGAAPGNATTAEIALISGAAADLGNYMTQMVTFPAGSSADQTVSITLTDDALFESDQTDYTLQIQNVSGGNAAVAGVNDEFVLTVYDDDFPAIVINEIAFRVKNDPSGDANGDGTTVQREDEFIEVVNGSGMTVDISGWTLSDADKIRHVFEASTILGDGEGITVFGGGTPTGITSYVQVASTGRLALTNNGDVVSLARPSGVVVDSHTWGAASNSINSLARNPDFTGSFVQHNTIATNPVAFSPGKRNADAVALPLELGAFWAEQRDNQVLLQWETLTELNNDYMAVERSADGRFYEEIGMVKGAGNSTELRHYQFLDIQPLSGTNYYRLRQVDFDGKTTYHKVISIYLDRAFSMVLVPNIVNSESELSWSIPLERDGKLLIINSQGQIVRNQVLPRGLTSTQIEAYDLPSGAYFLSVEGLGSPKILRFVRE